MTLGFRIRETIKQDGPIRLDRYIGICLYDPRDGYYATQTVFGQEGDFTTAPEISQIFGEIIGLWILSAWGNLGLPERFALIELGAGRGTLMADALGVATRDERFAKGLNLSILENSPRRREEQLDTIEQPMTHLDHLRDLEPMPTIVIANEFFDALPIRQFRNEGGGWLEAFVDEHLMKIWRPIASPPAELSAYQNADGIVELNENSIGFTNQIHAHFDENHGALLAIDYGDWQGTGDTLQAIEGHEYTDPFQNPGEADITAHVRFADLAKPFSSTPSFATQAQFLEAFGGPLRRDQLIQSNPTLVDDINSRYDRLTAPNEMGALFKVLAIEAY